MFLDVIKAYTVVSALTSDAKNSLVAFSYHPGSQSRQPCSMYRVGWLPSYSGLTVYSYETTMYDNLQCSSYIF